MDCKVALVDNGGDLEKATNALREKGMAQVAKRAGRDTTEGIVEAYRELLRVEHELEGNKAILEGKDEELRELHSRLRGVGVNGAALTVTGDFAQSLVKKLLRPLIVYAHRAAVNGQAHVLEEIVEQFRREIEKRVTRRPERDSPPRNRLRCPP